MSNENGNGNGFLSQEEIDALLNGGEDKKERTDPSSETNSQGAAELSDVQKDLLGEIGNISMGSASTALSTIINQQVNITTPIVTVTTLKKLKDEFEVPNIALEVQYTRGIVGENLLVMKVTDAAVIADLMMGGSGQLKEEKSELSEIEVSAVSEAMNQMIGSAATSMATMFMREVNISPPKSKIWTDLTEPLSEGISDEEPVVKVSFSLKIGKLVDSHIMQLFPMETAKKIVSIMMGQENAEEEAAAAETSSKGSGEKKDTPAPQPETQSPAAQPETQPSAAASNAASQQNNSQGGSINEKPIETSSTSAVNKKVPVKEAAFQPLGKSKATEIVPKNIDLILDVPLEISVVLGRTRKNIKDILNLGTGSLVELDKLAEEPVEILVNGKKIAYGEVVVVDENFGVRITGIVSNEERIKSLR
ncbi:flagellar motor switch phosphatase FliY [Clostridium luticellarii]|uniref:flagellar motor switch phosphatase FliY n=1 Tax=Clostridium luticellarii TaxID=1691940 RepID=UPI00235453B6|nr:flagellar motor switch phosphatase FliY [Clostridium luticellarii]MCI1943968.1 flagellar motor switch phosphatase FliY [Clostridium luticellarii]MCI1967390.1 flagellar motor switch phosphatase FliY [Clostridium luticellarii]MCI1996115.1 flagellar motor switch phosphatase FliY [Clostridium luticellarii]MCI2041264.1 flagellar motor switch phosphatase FliY [Clostridium luticellarii]